MKVLIVEYVISLRHAARIVRTLTKVKKHAAWGYYFDLQELPYRLTLQSALPEQLKMLYSEKYKHTTQLYHLKVFRDKEDKRPCEAEPPIDVPPLTAEAKLVLERLMLGVSLKELIDHANSIQGQWMKTDEEYQLLIKQVTYRIKQALEAFKGEPEHIQKQLNRIVLQQVVNFISGTPEAAIIEGNGLIRPIDEPSSPDR